MPHEFRIRQVRRSAAAIAAALLLVVSIDAQDASLYSFLSRHRVPPNCAACALSTR